MVLAALVTAAQVATMALAALAIAGPVEALALVETAGPAEATVLAEMARVAKAAEAMAPVVVAEWVKEAAGKAGKGRAERMAAGAEV